MLFITCDPYFSEINDFPLETNQECFVCFESGNGTIVRLNEIFFVGYEKKCDCNGSIHSKCLAKWYTLQQKCPICRQRMEKTILLDDLRIHSNELRLTIFLIVCKKIIFFFKIIGFLSTVYFFYDYLLVTNKIIKEYEYSSFY